MRSAWKPSLIGLVAAVAVLAALSIIHDRLVWGAVVVLIGICGFTSAVRLDEQQRAIHRAVKNPFLIVVRLVAYAPMPVSRALYVLMGITICSFGVQYMLA
jgi:hypothetical protein